MSDLSEPNETLEYRKVDQVEAVALVRIEGVKLWRWRRPGKTKDYPCGEFDSLDDFYNYAVHWGVIRRLRWWVIQRWA